VFFNGKIPSPKGGHLHTLPARHGTVLTKTGGRSGLHRRGRRESPFHLAASAHGGVIAITGDVVPGEALAFDKVAHEPNSWSSPNGKRAQWRRAEPLLTPALVSAGAA
jgi:hypothetical protein